MNHPAIGTTTLILLIRLAMAPIQANPVEASTSQIRNCKFLGQVEGLSGYGKNTRWQPIAKNRRETKSRITGCDPRRIHPDHHHWLLQRCHQRTRLSVPL